MHTFHQRRPLTIRVAITLCARFVFQRGMLWAVDGPTADGPYGYAADVGCRSRLDAGGAAILLLGRWLLTRFGSGMTPLNVGARPPRSRAATSTCRPKTGTHATGTVVMRTPTFPPLLGADAATRLVTITIASAAISIVTPTTTATRLIQGASRRRRTSDPNDLRTCRLFLRIVVLRFQEPRDLDARRRA